MEEVTGSWITFHNHKIHHFDMLLDVKMATTNVLTVSDWTHKNVKFFELHKLNLLSCEITFVHSAEIVS
jgi:hypothetical protein